MSGGHAPKDASAVRHGTDVRTSLRERVRDDPWPTIIWGVGAIFLVLVEMGAVLHFADAILIALLQTFGVSTGALHGTESALADIPTLLSRAIVPNRGHWTGDSWSGTFLDLSPARAWAIRVILVYAYTFVCLAWVIHGYRVYRQYYRIANWTPRDDIVTRFRTHYWGLFGLVVVAAFLTVVLFAPVLGPTTAAQNIYNPYGHTITYWSSAHHSLKHVVVGTANRHSRSIGRKNVGPMTYDDYGRFHPFGTTTTGSDLFTFLVYGARVSLVTALVSLSVSATFATAFALASAYYRGALDLGLVLLADAILALPQLLLIIMLSVVLRGTWISGIYSGGFLLGVIFALTGWPGLWRSVRGPALRVGRREWVEAAQSFGQRSTTIMRKHMLPYVTGYLLVYGSMTLGGAIIGIAGLSFLGLGINPPTPGWGRAINMGQPYVGTASWHISFIPGVLITILVLGFNALGDGIRDAIDPQSDTETADAGGVGRGGGA